MTRQRREEIGRGRRTWFLRGVRIIVAAAAEEEEEERDACLQMVMSVIGFAGV